MANQVPQNAVSKSEVIDCICVNLTYLLMFSAIFLKESTIFYKYSEFLKTT